MENGPKRICQADIKIEDISSTTKSVCVSCPVCPDTKIQTWSTGQTSVTSRATVFEEASNFLRDICPKYREDVSQIEIWNNRFL